MHEFKFRAWDKARNVITPPFTLWDIDQSEEGLHIWINRYGEIYEDELIIMQYTGLKDCEGREIYEGDIIETPLLTGVVTWDNFFGCWRVVDLDKVFNPALTYSRAKESNIIGNIFENPELLGGNDNV